MSTILLINSKEFKNLRSHFVTFRDSTIGRKYLPYVYTEQGFIAHYKCL